MKKVLFLLVFSALCGGVSSAAEPLGLERAILRVAENHPALSVAEAEVLASRAEALQAGLRPNPILSAELENAAGSGAFSGVDSAEYTFSISQTIEMGGKRSKRKEAALRSTEVAEWNLEGRRRALERITIRAFYSTLAAEARVSLSAQLVEMAQTVLAKAEQRVEAGRAHALEATKATLELADAELDLENSKLALESAKTLLASLWGGTAQEVGLLAGDLEQIPEPEPLAGLVGRLTQHPDALAAEAQIRQQQANAALENARRIPSVDLGAGVRLIEESGDQAFVFGLSVPLAFGDRNQGNREAARLRTLQAEDQYNAVRLALTQELVETSRAVKTAYAQAISFREKQLPSARLAFEQASDGYSKGLFGSLDLLDAMRGLFGQEIRYINALLACHQAQAELKSLTASGSKNELKTKTIEGEK